MIKSFIVEFLITAPCLIIISYVCVRLLEREVRVNSVARVTAIVSIGLITAFAVARAMPFVSFRLAPPQDVAAGQDDPLKRKNEFMKILDELVVDQSKLTKENKAKLFDHFKDLFPNGAKDRQVYYQHLSTFVDCNMSYFQDALAALKTKKNQKSEKRKQCQEMDGIFFNRPKLVPEEQAKVNDQVIETIAKGKKIMQDNKEVEINEGSLTQALEVQSRSKETLKIIFAEDP